MSIEDIIVEFEIPYLLEVRDSFDKNPEWRFDVSFNSVEAEFRFKKICIQEGVDGANYVRGNRNGLISRTAVQVWFNDIFYQAIPDRTNDETPDGDEMILHEIPGQYSRYVIGYSLDFLNQFLEAYRTNLDDQWVKPLGISDVIDFKVTADLEDGGSDTVIYQPGVEPIKELRVTETKRDSIQEFISEDKSVNLFKKIDLDTEDNIARREYDIAVLNSARLFEVWIKTAYIAIMDRREGSEEEARRIAIETPFGSFVEEKIRADIGLDIGSMPEYSEWKQKVWEVRKDVIHDGRRVEEEVANEAYRVTKMLLGRLLAEVGDELEDTTLHAEIDYP